MIFYNRCCAKPPYYISSKYPQLKIKDESKNWSPKKNKNISKFFLIMINIRTFCDTSDNACVNKDDQRKNRVDKSCETNPYCFYPKHVPRRAVVQ